MRVSLAPTVLPRPPLTVVAVFARDVAPERRAYLTIVLKPIILVLLLMWVSLPV